MLGVGGEYSPLAIKGLNCTGIKMAALATMTNVFSDELAVASGLRPNEVTTGVS